MENLFWGCLFIYAGILMMIKAVFKVQIPLARSILAFVLIYYGIKMILSI